MKMVRFESDMGDVIIRSDAIQSIEVSKDDSNEYVKLIHTSSYSYRPVYSIELGSFMKAIGWHVVKENTVISRSSNVDSM